MMPWVRLDDQFADHPKILAAGPLASWLYVCGLTYAARLLTDGFIPAGQVRKLADIANAQKLADTLVRVGLWDEADGGYAIHDYLQYNPSRTKTIATREARAEAGSLGGKQKASKMLERSQSAATEMFKQNPAPYPSPTQSPSPEVNSTSKDGEYLHTQPPPTRTPARKAVPPAVRDVVNAITQALAYDQDAQLSGKEYDRLVESATQIVGAGGTPADVPIRAERYGRKWPSIAVTHGGLAGRWGELAAEPVPRGSPNGANGHYVTKQEQIDINNEEAEAEFAAIVNGSGRHGSAGFPGTDQPPRGGVSGGHPGEDPRRLLPRVPEDRR